MKVKVYYSNEYVEEFPTIGTAQSNIVDTVIGSNFKITLDAIEASDDESIDLSFD